MAMELVEMFWLVKGKKIGMALSKSKDTSMILLCTE